MTIPTFREYLKEALRGTPIERALEKLGDLEGFRFSGTGPGMRMFHEPTGTSVSIPEPYWNEVSSGTDFIQQRKEAG